MRFIHLLAVLFVALVYLSSVWGCGCPCTPLESNPEKCIHISKTGLNFLQASRKCCEMGGKLFEPMNAAEDLEVKGRLYNTYYWIGADDIIQENRFVYHSSQTPLGSYQPWWRRDQPDNHQGRQNCVGVIRFNVRSAWDDRDCAERLRYVCECAAPPGTNGESRPARTGGEVAQRPQIPAEKEVA